MADNTKVYRDFTQEELDWEYNNRARVPNHDEILAGYKARGEDYVRSAPHTFNIAFGDSADEVLDVYPATAGDGAAPVLIYFHGGFWYSRHKNDFRFIGAGFAPAGATVVVVNYALIPSVDMPELIRQCRAAVAWTHANIEGHGGDPDRIFITGHSAGGHITAMIMGTDWEAWNVPKTAIKGAMALSGLYDLEPIRLSYMNATLGFSPEIVDDYSPINLKPEVLAPTVFAVGGNETDEFLRHNGMLPPLWGDLGMPCEEITVPDLDHFTILGDFAIDGNKLNSRMRALMGLG